MHILSSLECRNFRLVKCQALELGSGVHVLSGANGQGKTSFLEAIYFLSTLRSFRTSSTEDMISWGSSAFALSARLDPLPPALPSNPIHLACQYHQDGHHELAIDSCGLSKTSEFINQFFAIPLCPQDKQIVYAGPAERRRFLDVCMCQYYPGYMSVLHRLQRLLKERNCILRNQNKYGTKSLDAYDVLLADTACKVWTERQRFVDALNTIIVELVRPLASHVELSLHYDGLPISTGDPASRNQKLIDNFRINRQRDIDAGMTLSGPHRDDFDILLNGFSLRSFGSEGQSRLAVTILKCAFAWMVQSTGYSSPIVLVDDIWGELDLNFRGEIEKLLLLFNQILLVTCTGFPESILSKTTHRWSVSSGNALHI